MTNEQLQEGKRLEGLVRYHESENKDLLSKVKDLKRYIGGNHLRAESEYKLEASAVELKHEEKKQGIVFDTVRLANGSQVGVGYINIRPKALISYMETEAQYHFQEAEKYKREINRL